MDEPVLLDKPQVPEEADLARGLSRAKLHWDSVKTHALDADQAAMVEWRYYKKKTGRMFRVRDKRRNLPTCRCEATVASRSALCSARWRCRWPKIRPARSGRRDNQVVPPVPRGLDGSRRSDKCGGRRDHQEAPRDRNGQLKQRFASSCHSGSRTGAGAGNRRDPVSEPDILVIRYPADNGAHKP